MSATTDQEFIPFNKPYYTGKETENLLGLVTSRSGLSGNGAYTKSCQSLLEAIVGSPLALLTQSGTAALEMCAILCNLSPGDEVIMPSFTFVSTANAFVLQGAVPVFVDIDLHRGGIDPRAIAEAITPKTKVICVVHYAGIACDMDEIMEIARQSKLYVVEDAAHAIFGTYKDRMLGSIGDFAAFSFHETKNLQCGEGGALLVNNKDHIKRAEIIWEKGTNRKQFVDGLAPKYCWVDVGSSFLPSELTAAFLHAQILEGKAITQRRKQIWNTYYEGLMPLHNQGLLMLPQIPDDASHCAHLFFFYSKDPTSLRRIVAQAKQDRVSIVQHYVPLHNSPHGLKVSKTSGLLSNTEFAAATLLRLPIWIDLTNEQIQRIINSVKNALE